MFITCVNSHKGIAQSKINIKLDQEINQFKNDSSKINYLNSKGEALLNEGNFENALFYFNYALKIATQRNQNKKAVIVYQNIGNVHSDAGNNVLALKNYQHALALSKKINYIIGVAQTLNLIGIVMQNQGNLVDANKYFEEALHTNVGINYKIGILKNYTNIGNSYFYQGNYEKALKNHEFALKIARELNDYKNISNSLNNISICYINQGNYIEALNYLLKSLKINEASKNKQLISDNYLNISLIYYYQKNYEEALKYQIASLKINRELANKKDIAANYTNLSIIYSDLNKFDLALQNENEALAINMELSYKSGIAKNYRNIGNIHHKEKRYNDALRSYYAALEIDKELNDLEGISVSNCNIADALIQQHKYIEARAILIKTLNTTLETHNKVRLKEHYAVLYKLDSIEGKWKGAYFNSNFYHLYKDSLMNEVNTKKLVQSQMQYEFDKKQAADKIKQATKDAIASQEKKRQQIITMAISAGFLLVLIFSILILNRFKVTLKQKKIIEIQKQKVEHQKEVIEEKNKQVTDSINYAKRIQTAVLPPIGIFKSRLPNSCIFYLPKDIVAGDFYWQEKVDDLILFAACDCTGHGVPGAMVSVVCNNALNRAVREFNKIQPAEILDKTMEIVIENFYSSEDEIKDGMDISLCTYHQKTKQLNYAGANNPLWIIRNREIIEFKADKQAIGKNDFIKPFTNHIVQLEIGDTVFIFSDGYSDQFGGETGRKKLTKKRFKEFLLKINDLPIEQQGIKLESFFYDYKGETEQIDDILVIGLEVV